MDGLPESALGLASQQAVAAGHASSTPEAGPWMLTMDLPSFLPAMQHIKDRGTAIHTMQYMCSWLHVSVI